MTRDIVANIVILRKSINQAALQKQKEPIFTAVIENEQIVFDLSNLSCQSESEFRKLIEMLYKLIIESSGGGNRLPEDSRIEVMLSSLRELRNHFLHAREHGKESDVKKKYRKVGEIYFRLVGKRVPLEQDWASAKVGLLKLAEDGLERTFEIVTQELAIDTPYFENNNIELFGKGESNSFQSHKRRGLWALSDIPVFIPQFTINSPLPRIGGTNCCVHARYRSPFTGSISQFVEFMREIEQKWKDASYFLSPYGPLNWGISDDGHFAFGCGTENLQHELLRHKRVAVGGIMQGCYGEDNSKTCFLVLSGYRKGNIVKDICADLYLSCIPTDWTNFENLFKAFRHLDDCVVNIKNYSLKPLTFFSWETKQPTRVKLNIKGGLRREGYLDMKNDRETDNYGGVIVEAKSFSHLKFYRSDSSQPPDSSEHLNPIYQLKDVVVNITGAVPYCEEVSSGLITDVTSPRISTILFDAYGATIHAISITALIQE